MKKNQKIVSDSSRQSIKKKMFIRTITPTVIGLLVAGILISIITGSSIMNLQNEDIQVTSSNSANQINSYFIKYMETSRQLASDAELQSLFENLSVGSKINEQANYNSVMTTMTNMHNNDSENILVMWAADADSSQCIEDSGYVSEIGAWDITSRDWYGEVKDATDTIITEPYENSSTGEMVASVITPVRDSSGDLLGVAALDLSLSAVTNMMAEQKLGKTGFLLLMTRVGTIMYSKNESVLYSSIQETDISDNVKEGFANNQYGTYTYKFSGNKNYGYMTQVGESKWVVLSGLPNLEYNSGLYKVIISIVILFAIIIIVLDIIIRKIALGIVTPIHKLYNAADKIAQGELDVVLDIDSNDEIGEVAVSIGKTVDRLKDYIKYIDEIASVLDEIAGGNLLFKLEQDYAGEFGKIKDALENISNTLTKTIQSISTSASKVTNGAGQISEAAQSLAEGATNQAAAVEELLATVSDISNQVRENAAYAEEAASGAGKVKESIEYSNEEMRRLVDAMNEINECSDSIGEIISNIEGIADQTSLLSLNASIEAARAGELGKGFAVVANEVGNLSNESVKAVQKSTELIQNSIEAVQRGMVMVNETAKRLMKSVEGVVYLTDKMNEVSNAANAQMESLEQIELGIDQISSVVTDNSAMAQESAASSEQLSAEATALNEMIDKFHI